MVDLGPDTPYTSSSMRAAEPEVTKQNVTTSSTEALALEGKAVRLIWIASTRCPSPGDPEPSGPSEPSGEPG